MSPWCKISKEWFPLKTHQTQQPEHNQPNPLISLKRIWEFTCDYTPRKHPPNCTHKPQRHLLRDLECPVPLHRCFQQYKNSCGTGLVPRNSGALQNLKIQECGSIQEPAQWNSAVREPCRDSLDTIHSYFKPLTYQAWSITFHHNIKKLLSPVHDKRSFAGTTFPIFGCSLRMETRESLAEIHLRRFYSGRRGPLVSHKPLRIL